MRCLPNCPEVSNSGWQLRGRSKGGNRSRWGDSNSRPTAYKAVALPLSYIGWTVDSPMRLPSRGEGLPGLKGRQHPRTRVAAIGGSAVLSWEFDAKGDHLGRAGREPPA